jgi:hypothetical protein
MKKNQLLIILVLIVAILALFAILYPPGIATISWDKSTEADIAGYKIYYGLQNRTGNCPQGGYTDKIELKSNDLGEKPTYTFKNLKKSRTYFFSLTSFDKNNNESCFTDEFSKKIAYFDNAWNFWKSKIGLK